MINTMAKKYVPYIFVFVVGLSLGHYWGAQRAHAGFFDDLKKKAETVKSKANVIDDLKTFGRSLKGMDEDIKSLQKEMTEMQSARSNIANKLGVADKLVEGEAK